MCISHLRGRNEPTACPGYSLEIWDNNLGEFWPGLSKTKKKTPASKLKKTIKHCVLLIL